jgi:hypothetical protein
MADYGDGPPAAGTKPIRRGSKSTIPIRRETMRSHSLWVLGSFAGLALAGCATNGSPRYEQSNLQTAAGDSQLMSYRIRNWSAPNDHTVVFESADGTQYRAETLGPCFGLDFANRLGFANRGGFQQIDRFSSLVLPDGTRCSFQTFSRVVSPETKALDSFEKLSVKDEKQDRGASR